MGNHLVRVACALAVFLVAGAAHADSGRLRGIVTDQTGGTVASVAIEIRGLDTGMTRTTVSDSQGRYELDGLVPGRYRVSAALAGFETEVRDVEIGVDRIVDVNLRLVLARQEIAIAVSGTPAIANGSLDRRVGAADVADMLADTPGMSVVTGGGVSGQPAIHGLADDRVKVTVDGMAIEAACAGHMNPPLSAIAPANVGSIEVTAGITPVSRGGDSIAGTVAVESPHPEFAQGVALSTHGRVSFTHRANGAVNGVDAVVAVATPLVSVGYTGSYVNAGDYSSGGAAVKSTFYERANHRLSIAARRRSALFAVDLNLQRIPQQGFVNARMDMTRNDATSLNGRYEQEFPWGRVDARAYYMRTDHEMNVLRDKLPGMEMPMETAGTNVGSSIRTEVRPSGRDLVRVGAEVHRFVLDDWWPPVTTTVGAMGPDTLWNIRTGRRTRLATYAEWQSKRGASWTTLIGVRGDFVRMNTGDVAGYNASATTTGSAAYAADAAAFNAADRARSDNNLDVTALSRYEPGPTVGFDLGYARKTRSPSLYERYLWVKRSNMSVQMNGWFGDGNGYSGNLDLRPEVAHTLSATIAWRDGAARDRELKATPYYTFVRDYIGVDRCLPIAGSNGCTAQKLAATSGFVNLQFANHDARLYGLDVSGQLVLVRQPSIGTVTVSGVAGYVRGRNLDTADNLYQMMPLHATMTLEHALGRWSGAIALDAVSSKTAVEAVRNELATPGYVTADARGGYRWEHLRIDVGIENFTDRRYVLPLGGRYWVGDKTGMSAVPGMGRAAFAGVTAMF